MSWELLAVSWDLLDAYWRLLGCLAGLLKASWAVLQASWALVGPSWRHLRLGAILAASWALLSAILASQKPPKIIPRTVQEASQNDVNLGRWGTPEILLKPMKNHEF